MISLLAVRGLENEDVLAAGYHWAIFSLMFDAARVSTLRDKSRPRWFNDSLAICCYVLSAATLVSAFISWKISVIGSGLFVLSLIAGALTEADEIGAH